VISEGESIAHFEPLNPAGIGIEVKVSKLLRHLFCFTAKESTVDGDVLALKISDPSHQCHIDFWVL
jgi:hypothetical protein